MFNTLSLLLAGGDEERGDGVAGGDLVNKARTDTSELPRRRPARPLAAGELGRRLLSARPRSSCAVCSVKMSLLSASLLPRRVDASSLAVGPAGLVPRGVLTTGGSSMGVASRGGVGCGVVAVDEEARSRAAADVRRACSAGERREVTLLGVLCASSNRKRNDASHGAYRTDTLYVPARCIQEKTTKRF